MPRIRSIVPEFWEDERLARISPSALLLFIGMKNFADDQGVIVANEVLIRNKVFPVREDIRRQQVGGWLRELCENSVIVPFAYEGRGYFMMDFSSERIDKPQRSKIPQEVIDRVRRAERREETGMFGSVPAGEERRGKERNGRGRRRGGRGGASPGGGAPEGRAAGRTGRSGKGLRKAGRRWRGVRPAGVRSGGRNPRRGAGAVRQVLPVGGAECSPDGPDGGAGDRRAVCGVGGGVRGGACGGYFSGHA